MLERLPRIGPGIALLYLWTLAIGCQLDDTYPESGREETAAKADFVALFNGRDLEGWERVNGAEFSVRDGVLFVDRGTGWLRSKRQFGDAIFRLEFRFLEEGANSGIFVRTGSTSKTDENGWPDDGYQVQCMDTVEGAHPLATMIPYGAPPFEHDSDLDALVVAYRRGDWNTYEIECRGKELTVRLNNVVVTRATSIERPRGHVGIQAEHGRLEFRRLEIAEF